MASTLPPAYSTARGADDASDATPLTTGHANLDDLDESILDLPDRDSGYANDDAEAATQTTAPNQSNNQQA